MTQELDRNQCIHGRPQKLFQGGKRQNFAYPFQVADDAMQMDVHKTLYLSNPLVCAGRTSILNLLSEMFSALRLSEMLFLFKNCLISIFCERFPQISRILRNQRPKHER